MGKKIDLRGMYVLVLDKLLDLFFKNINNELEFYSRLVYD
jgi:hypothetical protein